MGGRSRSAPAQPTETRVTQTDLPEYVQPYFERLLKRGEAESNQPYTPYGGERIAYFSPDELTSQAMTRGYAQSGTPLEFQLASQRAAMLGGPYGSGYQAGLVGSGYQAGQQREAYDAQTYQPGYQAGLVGSGYTARDLGLGFGASGIQSGYQPTDTFSTYNPFTRQSQYTAGDVGEQFTPLSYEENIQRFISPFQQNVIDIQKREATRQSEMMGDKTADAAVRSGGLGGYREAILQAERERNLSQQLDDIQAKGSLGAFQSAQAQLAAERQAQLTGQQFNLQQYMAEEQARQRETQLDTQRYQVGESARQAAAKLGLTAAQQNEAARQAQEKYMQSAFAMTEKSFQEQGRQDIERFKAQEAARQAQERFGQSAFDMSQRFGLASVDALRDVSGDIQDDVRQRIGALTGIGAQQRAMQQASMDMGYQDFLRQQGFTQQQLGFLGGLLRGVPVQPQQQISTFQQQPGLFQSALGMGLQGLGLYKGMS